MTKVRILILIGFLVAFGAGLVVGMLMRRTVAGPPVRSFWMEKELGLSPAQVEKVKQIWSNLSWDGDRSRGDLRMAMRKERDEAIMALLRPDQKEAYDKIQRQYTEKMAAFMEPSRMRFQAAMEQIRQILTNEQRNKFDELMKKRAWLRQGDGRQPASRPTSQPVVSQ